jgi:hypothetical protein
MIAATLLPDIERLGIAAAQEVDLPNLARRILSDVGEVGAVIGRAEVGAWTKFEARNGARRACRAPLKAMMMFGVL